MDSDSDSDFHSRSAPSRLSEGRFRRNSSASNVTDLLEPDADKSHGKLYYAIVAGVFVFSGSMSTIASKWNDMLEAKGASDEVHKFNHPFAQTWLMFLGEFTCMIAFQLSVFHKRRQGYELEEGKDKTKPMTPFIFAIPALCDFTASTTMYYGLTMTQASVYQMLRGAVVLFTGFFSRIFLKRKFVLYQWFGMFIVTSGLAMVGAASMTSGDSQGASNPVLGDILVVCAQVIVAGQMTIEEKIMTKWDVPPMLLVGWEGTFGLLYTTTALAVFQAFPTPPDDVVDAVLQVSQDWRIFMSCFLALLSFPLLNGTGQVITKNISATARMVLDTVRNVVVWVFTLILSSFFGEKFYWLQLGGFILLIAGNAIYRHILVIPHRVCKDPADLEGDDETTRLVQNDVENVNA